MSLPTPVIWRARADVPALLCLYAVALAVNLTAVLAANTGLVLTGEEMSVSIRDPLFSVEQRAQASIWSTNFGAPVYYWIASHLDPSYSLFSGRRWKAAAMALAAPLVYLIATRRLRCARPSGLLAGATVALLPGVAMFGWLATENGLESVIGAAGLMVAMSARRGWQAAPLLGGLAVTTYTSGLAWAAVIGLVCVIRAVGAGWRSVGLVVAAGIAAVLVVVFPRLWWIAGPQRLVAGGGTFEGTVTDNLANLATQLAVSGRSYYFFGDQPALGSAALAIAAAGAVLVAAWARWQKVWPWLAVALATVVLWVPAGNVPGVRRAVALSIVGALVLGVAIDVATRMLPARGRSTLLVATAAAVLTPLVATTVCWQADHRSGREQLVADFPIEPGPMPPTFDRFDRQLRDGELTTQQMVVEHDGLRTLAVIWMLAARNNRDTSGLPAPEEIVAATVPVDLQPPKSASG